MQLTVISRSDFRMDDQSEMPPHAIAPLRFCRIPSRSVERQIDFHLLLLLQHHEDEDEEEGTLSSFSHNGSWFHATLQVLSQLHSLHLTLPLFYTPNNRLVWSSRTHCALYPDPHSHRAHFLDKKIKTNKPCLHIINSKSSVYVCFLWRFLSVFTAMLRKYCLLVDVHYSSSEIWKWYANHFTLAFYIIFFLDELHRRFLMRISSYCRIYF